MTLEEIEKLVNQMPHDFGYRGQIGILFLRETCNQLLAVAKAAKRVRDSGPQENGIHDTANQVRKMNELRQALADLEAMDNSSQVSHLEKDI